MTGLDTLIMLQSVDTANGVSMRLDHILALIKDEKREGRIHPVLTKLLLEKKSDWTNITGGGSKKNVSETYITQNSNNTGPV